MQQLQKQQALEMQKKKTMKINQVSPYLEEQAALQQALAKQWFLTRMEKSYCSEHFMMRWQGSYTALRKDLGTGFISFNAVTYAPVLLDCTWEEVSAAKHCFLSFRRAENSVQGIVLIKLAHVYLKQENQGKGTIA